MMGEEGDLIPVKDYGPSERKQAKTEDIDALQQRAVQQHRMVSKWSREDLEDKYMRQYEENLLLKKHARKQEDKIKRMATKLLRLVSDKKKSADGQNTGKRVHDIETEEMLEELHGKVRELEHQNKQLKEKLMVTKQQLSIQPSRKMAYQHVQPRINTGIAKATMDPRLTKSMRVSGPVPPQRLPQSPTGMPRYGHSLLEETRAENRQLEQVIQGLHEQINLYEQDIEMLKEQMKVREAEYEEDLLKLKQQMSIGQRATIQENISVIRLQREVKEKSTKLTQLQAQYASLEEKLHMVRSSYDQVMMEMERTKQQVMEEQNRRLAVESELRIGTTSQRTLIEYQERIRDMEKECEILKEANEKLVASAFDLEREREWRQKENALKVQIAQLEATLRADVGEKGSILDRLSSERDAHETLEEEHRELRINYFQLKQDYDELRDKMKFFTKESEIDFQEIEEALMIVKQKKERQHQELDFLYKVEEEQSKDYQKLLKQLQTEHADTINELEKTRNMLITQHKINKDYQMEVEEVTRKMEELKQEYETRQEELAHLLDIRAVRIRKLEAQLRDVAYGTRQYRIHAEDVPEELESDLEDLEETISLERGENLFEIHIKKISLSQEALRLMGDQEPNVFATLEFYEFDTQATPVIRSEKPEFNFTSQYVVKVDDFFLHYLQKDACTLELHQSFGTDYSTVAACQLKIREILDKSHGRLHGSVMLTGVTGDGKGINFGIVEYWVRLKVPMEQALRLYKERSKALGYLQSNIRASDQALEAMDEDAAKRPTDNMNHLHVKILRCASLVGRREGIQPSPYCAYTFFDFTAHDTPVIQGSNNPEYNDHKNFPVPMTADLDKYLRSQSLQVFAFDDIDPEDTYYLGLAKIPLLPLAHNKPIKGIFELFNAQGEQSGTVEVSIKWQFNYLPPKSVMQTLPEMKGPLSGQRDDVHLLPGEDEALQKATVPEMKDKVAVHRTQRRGPDEQRVKQKLDHLRQQQQQQQTLPHLQSLHPSGSHDTTFEQNMIFFSIRGTPVPGESEPVSSLSDTSTSHGIPPLESRPLPPKISGMHRRPVPQPRRFSASQRRYDDESSPMSHKVGRKSLFLISDGKQLVDEELDEKQDEDEMTPNQLIAAEFAKDSMNMNDNMEDTLFEDQKATLESEDMEELQRNNESQLSDRTSAAETEDSEVVVASPSSRPQSAVLNMNPGDFVQVAISELSLNEDSPLLQNDHVDKLYVEYTFLGVPREETETPYSLPKPDGAKPISFNFTKVFHVDYEKNYERRQYLASMLLPDDPEQGRIKFSVVSEPDDEDEDCEDVGVAYADLKGMLDSGRDMENEDIPILNPSNESEQLGSLRVTVKCVAALRAVQQEMRVTDSSLEA
ncbi:hypothetical protein LSH36_590g01020 [Paralvinella palmiformis]|uniref:C2 domain-containing protein n=1 Tax=Paralvinella palmiformis TaxID=53620 RepID=A0AAD9J4X2_9ANNE|nr:hypothetical protein LSH36_590g01020 [Paralvinella palmiformis]